jgi:hypothetical protein
VRQEARDHPETLPVCGEFFVGPFAAEARCEQRFDALFQRGGKERDDGRRERVTRGHEQRGDR